MKNHPFGVVLDLGKQKIEYHSLIANGYDAFVPKI